MKFIFIFSTLLISGTSFAEQKALPFDLIKNGVTVLPTQVRYVINRKNGEIRIADSILKRSSFFIRRKGNQLALSWPAGIFENPKIRIVDGAETLFESIAKKSSSTWSGKSPDKFLSWKGTYRLCVSDQLASPSATVCSEIYRTRSGKSVLARKKFKAAAFINGSKAGPKGTIAVTPGGPPLALKLTSPSGFYFESELKIEKRNFLNLQKTSQSQYRLEFRKQTALPDSAPEVITVDAKEPIVTVKEPGQVPMVQEMIIKDLVPTAKDRVYFADENAFEVYSGIVRIRLQKESEKIELTPIDGTIRTVDEKQVEWQIKNLQVGETRRSYLAVKRDTQTLMTYAEVTRHRAMELGFHLGSMPVTGATTGNNEAANGTEIHGQFRFGWWFDDFFRMRVDWLSWQRWGYELEIQKALQSPQAASLGLLKSTVKYRLNRGIHHLNPTIGIKSTFQLISESSITASAIGLGLFGEFRSPSWIRVLTGWLFDVPHWIYIDAIQYPVTIDRDLKLQTLAAFNLRYKYMLTDTFDLDLTYINQIDKMKLGRDKELDSKISMLMLGMSYRF